MYIHTYIYIFSCVLLATKSGKKRIMLNWKGNKTEVMCQNTNQFTPFPCISVDWLNLTFRLYVLSWAKLPLNCNIQSRSRSNTDFKIQPLQVLCHDLTPLSIPPLTVQNAVTGHRIDWQMMPLWVTNSICLCVDPAHFVRLIGRRDSGADVCWFPLNLFPVTHRSQEVCLFWGLINDVCEMCAQLVH